MTDTDRIAVLEELLEAATGSDVETRVRATIMKMHAALKERNADEGMLNLISGFAHVAALAIVKGRWAALEHRDNERLRAAITDAPHDDEVCDWDVHGVYACRCWKAAALAVGAGQDTTND